MKKYAVVQPFDTVFRLDSYNNTNINIEKKGIGLTEDTKIAGFVFCHINSSYLVNTKQFKGFKGDVGFVWSARKDIFSNVGFYDRFIQGSSDGFMAHVFCKKNNSDKRNLLFTKLFLENQKKWEDVITSRINDGVYYTKGYICHLWHGPYENRAYSERREILEKYSFDPNTDIKIDNNNCWKWSSDKKELHKYMKDHFMKRKECSVNFFDKILYFLKKILRNL